MKSIKVTDIREGMFILIPGYGTYRCTATHGGLLLDSPHGFISMHYIEEYNLPCFLVTEEEYYKYNCEK